jgi:hypothetical protein
MIHLLAVLTGAALMLWAAIRISSSDPSSDIAAQVRFLVAGLMLTSCPEAIDVLGSPLAWAGLTETASRIVSAVLIAACIAAVLPHDPDHYRDLLIHRPAVESRLP